MMTNEEYIEEANKIIRTLVRYGRREETYPKWMRVYAWSNGNACWYPVYYAKRPNRPISMDANEFAMPNIPNDLAWKLVKEFDTLPLYRNSFEYDKERKEPPKPIPDVPVELAPFQTTVRAGDRHIHVYDFDICDDCGVPWGSPHKENVEH